MEMLKLYKFRSLKNIEFTLDIILNKRLYCSLREELNDPFEGLYHIIFRPSGAFSSGLSVGFDSQVKVDKTDDSSLKICCLSSSMNDVKMWSFYGDDHKGISIEIDIDRKKCFEVKYKKKLPLLSSKSPPINRLTNKTKDWEYESEYRIIQSVTFYLIESNIKKIYAGNRISPIHLELLKKIVPTEIPIHRTNLDPHEIQIIPGDMVDRT